jgi:hypothetical protein
VAGCDSGDSERDSVALAQFLFSLRQQADERAVYVAEAQETEIVVRDGSSHGGLKPRICAASNAALKRRSSTLRTVDLPHFKAPLFHNSNRRSSTFKEPKRLSYEIILKGDYPITVVCSGLIL